MHFHSQDRVNGFICQCAAGYVGDQCETEIDECDSDPCQYAIRCDVSIKIECCPIQQQKLLLSLFVNYRILSTIISVSVSLDTMELTVKWSWMNVLQILV